MKNDGINYCRLNTTWREDFDSLLFEYNKGNTCIKISSPKNYLSAKEFSMYKEFMEDNYVNVTECENDNLILEVKFNKVIRINNKSNIDRKEKVINEVVEQISFLV